MFDWVEGRNNMNEEWFGITALGPYNSDGVATARPRMAYDVMQEIFAIDIYGTSKTDINNTFANLDLPLFQLRGDVRALKADAEEAKGGLRMTGGRLQGEMVFRGTEKSVTQDGEQGVDFSDGQMAFIDFEFQPTDKISGQFTINALANVADKRNIEFTYGDRGLPLTIVADVAQRSLDGEFSVSEQPIVFNDRERVEIYDFNATYEGEKFDIEAFYHTSRFHWGYEGDHFGLLRESTDIIGSDIWNAKAPEGIEIIGKEGAWDGLTLLFGPEVYWGANPKAMLKYDFRFANWDWTFIHSEDFARLDEGASATQATDRQSRQTTLTAEREFGGGLKLELGGIISAPERIDEGFDRIDASGNIFFDEIDFEDTLGFRAKVEFPFLGTQSYVLANTAGLVANAGQHHRTFGVMDPSALPNSGFGNKNEVEAGLIWASGDWMVMPRVLYRDNHVSSNPIIDPSISGAVLRPGINPRDTDGDPFAVLGNREARSGEVYLTYDPTGGTQFYAWDNDWSEDAELAFNIGATYTEYPYATDAYLIFLPEFGTNASFGQGLPAEEVWTIKSRIVMNPSPTARYIFRLEHASQQSTGNPVGGTRDFSKFIWKAEWNRKHVFEGHFMKDAWGPYDFYQQLNFTFPEQYRLDYSIRLGSSGFLGDAVAENNATRIGIRGIYRTVDENSPPDEFLDGTNDSTFMTVIYFTYQF